ncbi:hypothetical protein O181_065586 [Austropuccinia psidii MF-1]|uniref:Uncharacterized protein n=1 Tax=Austropuccinia psidii MF-1 TaxID=1389203 RepID=A0A9Q3EP92_9BASI|nr:hypothetical protein [Austropuccinia psidii MF-1]
MSKLFNVCQNLNQKSWSHVFGNNPHLHKAIKPDSPMESKHISQTKYQNGDSMTYTEKEVLKQLQEATSRSKFCGVGEYDHMELVDYIDGIFIEVPGIPDYWIKAILNTGFKGHASRLYTEIRDMHGKRNWPWWKGKIIQKWSNVTWIWKKTM